MDDFFKRIKQNLEDSPPPSFVEEDWRKLERQLAESDSDTAPFVATRWHWVGVMGMLGLLLIAGTMLYDKQQQVYALEQKLAQFIQRDTVYLAEKVIQYDTIYITKYKSTAASLMPRLLTVQTSTTSSLPIQQDIKFIDQEKGLRPSSQTVKADIALNDSTTASKPLKIGSQIFVKESSNNIDILSAPSLIDGLTIQPLGIKEHSPIFPVIVVEGRTAKGRPRFNFLRPTSYYLNVNGGVGVSIGNKIHTQLGDNFGLDLHMSLGQNIGIWGGVRYLRSRYELEEPLSETELPVIAPPSPGYMLVNVDVARSTLSYAFGFRYSLPLQKKWRAQLDLGITSAYQFPFEAQFEYRNELDDKEWLLPVEVDRYERVPGILTGRLGASYSLGKRLQSSILMTYLQGQGVSNLQWRDQIILETGLNYFF